MHCLLEATDTQASQAEEGVERFDGGGRQREAGEQAETALDFNEALGARCNLIRRHSGDNNIRVKGLVRGHVCVRVCMCGREREREKQ